MRKHHDSVLIQNISRRKRSRYVAVAYRQSISQRKRINRFVMYARIVQRKLKALLLCPLARRSKVFAHLQQYHPDIVFRAQCAIKLL